MMTVARSGAARGRGRLQAVRAAAAAELPARRRPRARRRSCCWTAFEVFFGGAAGGGKTAALLMAALQYTDVPGYHALLVRPSLTELYLPGNLIDLSHEWLTGHEPAGTATCTSGASPAPAAPAPAARRSGSATSPTKRRLPLLRQQLLLPRLRRADPLQELQYRRMLRVLRQPTGLSPALPPATAPGSPTSPYASGRPQTPAAHRHEWVRARFVDPDSRTPAPSSSPPGSPTTPTSTRPPTSKRSAHLPTAERERLLHGNWEIPDDGELFKREWFPVIERGQLPDRRRAVRYWDLAATEPGPANRGPRLHRRAPPRPRTATATSTSPTSSAPARRPALSSGSSPQPPKPTDAQVTIVIEEEGGASGKPSATATSQILRGYSCTPTGRPARKTSAPTP